MKKRERMLAGVVLGFVALFVLGFGIKGFFVKPLNDIDKQTALIREKINKINNRNPTQQAEVATQLGRVLGFSQFCLCLDSWLVVGQRASL